MPNTNKAPDFKALGKKVLRHASVIAQVESLNFFKESFEKKGFTDSAFTPWEARKADAQAGGNLLQPTGNLRDSLQVLSSNKLQIVFGTHVPYANIHNEGGTLRIPITAKSRKFFWFMYHKTQQSHWKWMAITKKTELNVRIPKRQFMGHSQQLMQTLHNELQEHIAKSFTTLKNS